MSDLPSHVAIIMDGNGRWAKKRFLPRNFGHKAGVKTTRNIIEACSDLGIKALTLFAFSSENWNRPKKEVGLLMELFFTSMQAQVKGLHESNVRMQFIGDVSSFSEKLQQQIARSVALTKDNIGLELRIAVNYGGRWDITNAVRSIARQVTAGEIDQEDISDELVSRMVSLSDLPAPDLFIRTGGEQRISNFLLWQLAYTELYFSDTLWPDFDESELELAFKAFSSRQRRFGCTGEQVEGTKEDA
ncbi:MAG TPA: isoprenyl transferase [Gammaproteobacteria bacterium]|nr:isoprenyl transferase [Gammaproteobacteria bacterium]